MIITLSAKAAYEFLAPVVPVLDAAKKADPNGTMLAIRSVGLVRVGDQVVSLSSDRYIAVQTTSSDVEFDDWEEGSVLVIPDACVRDMVRKTAKARAGVVFCLEDAANECVTLTVTDPSSTTSATFKTAEYRKSGWLHQLASLMRRYTPVPIDQAESGQDMFMVLTDTTLPTVVKIMRSTGKKDGSVRFVRAGGVRDTRAESNKTRSSGKIWRIDFLQLPNVSAVVMPGWWPLERIEVPTGLVDPVTI